MPPEKPISNFERIKVMFENPKEVKVDELYDLYSQTDPKEQTEINKWISDSVDDGEQWVKILIRRSDMHSEETN